MIEKDDLPAVISRVYAEPSISPTGVKTFPKKYALTYPKGTDNVFVEKFKDPNNETIYMTFGLVRKCPNSKFQETAQVGTLNFMKSIGALVQSADQNTGGRAKPNLPITEEGLDVDAAVGGRAAIEQGRVEDISKA